MGLSFGGTNSTSQSSGSSTPTYNSYQTALQGGLSSVLSSLLPGVSGGGLSPNVQATATQNANSINSSYNALSDRMNRYLASRGFGQSGQVGQNQLQTEIGREGALASNLSGAANTQIGENNTLLSDALMYSFANPGSSNFGTTAGSSSGWGVSASPAMFAGA